MLQFNGRTPGQELGDVGSNPTSKNKSLIVVISSVQQRPDNILTADKNIGEVEFYVDSRSQVKRINNTLNCSVSINGDVLDL